VASKYAIETVFKLIDQVSAPTSRVGKALDSLGIKSKAVSNALKRDFDKAAARIDRLSASIKKWAGRAVLGGIAAIGIGIGVATKQFIEFDDALHKAGSIFSDLNPLADDFKTRLDAIGKAARNVAAATEFNAEQTASALATMAMAGIKSEQAISLLPKVADMATAAGVDLDKAVGMAAGALNVFGKMTNDPLKLAENLQYVSDVMVRGANLADMSLSDMSASVSTGGAAFKEANQRVEDYIAAIDILASVNKKGTEAGKAVSAMMTRLAAKPSDVSKALNELGIRTQDAQGNMLNFVDIMGQLNIAMNGMGTAKKSEYLYRIFGQNRIEYARPLVDAGVEGFRTYSRELENAAGSTAQVAEVMRQSIKNKLAILGSAATEMGFKFVEAFKDKAVTAIESATKAIENFDVAPLVEMASAAADGIMKFAVVLVGAVKTAWQFRYVIIAITAPIAAYSTALMVAIPIIKLYTKLSFIATLTMGTQAAALGMLKKGTIGYLVVEKLFIAATAIKNAILAVATKGTIAQTAATASLAVSMGTATVAQWLLNAAMNANPIGVVILAITALVGIIAALIKWGKKAAVVFIAIATFLTGPVGLAIGLISSMIVEIVKNVDQIKKAFTDGGFIEGLKRIGGVLLSGILAPVQGLLEILSYIPGLGHLAGKGAEKIEEFRNFLKGVDGATVTADVNVPDTVEAEITPPVDTAASPYDAPGFGIPGIGAAPGTGGKSKLHGVVDISGGAIPDIDGEGTYTTTSAVDNASAPGTATSALTSHVISIAAILQRIDASVSLISRSLPPAARAELPAIAAPGTATRTSLVLPRVNMGGGDSPDYHNPRDISPVTQAERMAYSLEERRNTIVIEVAAEKGTAARIVRAPRDVDIQLVTSGGNA
jgi:TP901 family phage tail tape measure protein